MTPKLTPWQNLTPESAAPIRFAVSRRISSIKQENLVFTNIEEFLWSDYTAGGAWIYQGDWSTLPGYVRSWLDGEVE